MEKRKATKNNEWRKKVLHLLTLSEEVMKVKSSKIMDMSQFSGTDGMTLTVEEAQERYRLGQSDIEKIVRGECAAIYIGNRWFILEARIEEYLHEQEERN